MKHNQVFYFHQENPLETEKKKNQASKNTKKKNNIKGTKNLHLIQIKKHQSIHTNILIY